MSRLACGLAVLLALAAPAVAGKAPGRKEPGPAAKGKVYAWKARDGLAYWYFVPKGYDAARGANLTLILHGSNLSAGWGFSNHKAGTFRPEDVVVSPDGTTPNGRGGFNFLGERKDAKRLHALIGELKKTFTVRNVYLYGHSQGSFFALYYAGEYPDDVQGVVAHASGVWNWTQQGSRGRGIAIVLMHGTADPVVPYAQSAGGYESYVKAGYPMVRLRSLEGWNHWPAEHNGPVPHTSQQLAWVEGMTTTDMDRLAACFDVLATVRDTDQHDYAALYTLAEHVSGLEAAPEALKRRAARAMQAVEALAAAHVAALKVPKGAKFARGGWIGHLPVFLRSFMDVPAREAFAKEWDKLLARQRKDAVAHLRKYYQALRKGDEADAFAEGVAAVEAGFLYYECQDTEFRKRMADLRKRAKKLRAPKQAIKRYDALFADLGKSLKEGWRDFSAVNRKHGRL